MLGGVKENPSSHFMVSLPSGEYPVPGDEGVLRKVGDTTRDAIAGHVQAAFELAKRNREANNVDEEFSLALHQMRGEYPPEVLAQLKAKGIPAIYLPVTDTKCRGLLARLSEVVGRDDIMEMRASAVPEPPVSVVESIAQRSMKAVEDFGLGYILQSGLFAQGVPPEMVPLLPQMAMEVGLALVPKTHIHVLSSAIRTEYDRKATQEAEEAARRMTVAMFNFQQRMFNRELN
jgi:hypothetical protein